MRPEARPRKLLRISRQAEDYITAASDDLAKDLEDAFDALENPEEHFGYWEDRVFDSVDHPNRAYLLLPNLHLIVWQPMGDAPGYFTVFYIGPADEWIG